MRFTGETDVDAVVAPLLQRYETPPEAVSVALAPYAMVTSKPAFATGGDTPAEVTTTASVAVQPAVLVIVTVYVVVVVGETVMLAVVAPVLHRKVPVPPVAVSIALGLLQLTDTSGPAFTVLLNPSSIVTDRVMEHPFESVMV